MNWKKVGIVISHEYTTRVRKKSFILTTLLTPIGMGLLICVPMLIMLFSGNEQQKVKVIDQSGIVAPYLENSEHTTYVMGTEGETVDLLKDIFDELDYYAIVGISPLDEKGEGSVISYSKESKKHMMFNIFGEYGSPFYKFGDLMFLPKISRENWVAYIKDRFTETKKSISDDAAGYLADLVENHSYYVQQLAQYAWLRTDKVCSEEIVDAAFQGMLDSLNLQFVNLMDSMTEKQRSFLCAICDGVKNLSSVETLSRYRLGTSGNIRIIKGALKKRDLIEETGHQVEIQDPLFKQWIRRIYKKL